VIFLAHSHERGGHTENQWAHLVSHWKEIEVIPYDDIPDDVEIVLLAPKNGHIVSGEISLHDFEHPENACYVIGPDHVHFQLDLIPRPPDHIVYIPLDGYQEMYSWVSAGIVLYDRSLKNG